MGGCPKAVVDTGPYDRQGAKGVQETFGGGERQLRAVQEGSA